MLDVPIKIIGISATGVIDGNCDKVMKIALETAADFDHVETEFITLANKEIMACTHCQWCQESKQWQNESLKLTEKFASQKTLESVCPSAKHVV